MNVTKGLVPASAWNYFEEITKVPRPSKKEEKILDYLVDFANKNGLQYRRDAIGNIVIIRPASAGKEKHQTVILQNHVDMVCEKNSDVVKDFEKDPIDIYVDGEWLKARGTTLGADCGIGMAMAMAVLTDKNISTPQVEALFTVDEETGLTGAFELGKEMLTGKYLINIDSEDEGEVYIGCAGGIDTLASFPFTREEIKPSYKILSLSVAGLSGGHSGDDINKNLGNSNILLCRFLFSLGEDFQLLSFDGGNLRNAIPREATAVIAVADVASVTNKFADYEKVIKAEYYKSEPNMKLTVSAVNVSEKAICSEVANNVISAVVTVPNGVQAMSQDIAGFVETSTNLASVKVKGDALEIVTSQRSSLESKKLFLAAQLNRLFTLYGGTVLHSDGYPGWAPIPSSNLLEMFKSEYKAIFGKEIAVKVIHAGLECGLILKKYPELEMVSVGPTLRGVHSPEERLEIKTVDMVWKLLVAVIEKI